MTIPTWAWFVLAPAALVVVKVYVRGEHFHPLWPYVPGGDLLRRTPRMETAAREAEGLSFTPLGVHRDAREGKPALRCEFWISARHDVLLLVGGYAGIAPIDECWLFSQLSDGRTVATLNDARADRDLSGLRMDRVHPGANVVALLDLHRDHLRGLAASPIAYSTTDPLEDHRAALSRQILRMVEQGDARLSGKHWRYSLKGAVRVTMPGKTA